MVLTHPSPMQSSTHGTETSEQSRFRTIIVGGGVAGLGCAHRLTTAGDRDFLLLTENIGGRIPTSADGDVNYGAFYVREDYEYISRFTKHKRRIRIRDVLVFSQNHWRSLLDVRNWRHLIGLIRLLWFLRRFRLEYAAFRRLSVHQSQKEAMVQVPWLQKLFRMPATELIDQLGIHFWSTHFLQQLVRSTAFLEIPNISGGVFAACCLPITTAAYEFEFQLQALIHPFAAAIRMTSVVRIERTDVSWIVETAGGDTFTADCVVLATPLHVAQRLVPVPEPTNPPVSARMVHLRGTLRPAYARGNFHLFPAGSDEIAMVHEPNGTVLFYSRSLVPDLQKYFVDFEVLAERLWDPAFFIGTEMLEADRGNGLLLIGDHSICSLEDAFITGLFAANQILHSKLSTQGAA